MAETATLSVHLERCSIHPERFPTIESFPYSLEVIQSTKCIEFDTPVTFFCGENGTGKSTLLEAIARRCGIHIWGEVYRSRSQRNPYEKQLFRALDVQWRESAVPGSYFDSQLFRNFSTLVDEWASADPGVLDRFGGMSLLNRSHGQALMAYFTTRYHIPGVYFLDEPETALSPTTQMELLELLTEIGAAGHAQFIIASHSPILLSCPNAAIYHFTAERLERRKYEETEHYKVYRTFFDSYGRMHSQI